MECNKTRCKISKNKVAPPFKEAEFDLLYGVGISYVGEVLDMAVNLDIVNKSGAWFSYKQERIGQGRENAKIYLEQHQQLCSEIENLVKQSLAKINSSSKKPSVVAEKAVLKDPGLAVKTQNLGAGEPRLDIVPDASDFAL